MRKYSKYKKFNKSFNPYMVLIVVIICMFSASIGYAYFSDTLSISGNANAKYVEYMIEYVLNGGINPENAVASFKVTEDIPLPIPTKEGYRFKGWYNIEGVKFATTKKLTGDTTLYANWAEITQSSTQYSYNGEYTFTGNNYINTNVYLYNEENMHKNFIISFDIIEVDYSKNVNHSALMNSMNEAGSPWYGNVVKVSGSGNSKSLKFESNSDTNSSGDVYISDTVRNVRVIRIDDILYYSFDNDVCVRINQYQDFKKPFNVPVTFGASMDGNISPYRYFTGTLANMYVAFLDDGATIDDFNPLVDDPEEKIVYENLGPVVMNGQSDYIDTGIALFSQENVEKDFEISFNIDSVAEGNESQATLLNLKNERITSYPGFVYRLYQQRDNTIKLEGKGGTGSGASNKIPNVQKVKISRKNSKIYISINDGNDKLAFDYSGFSNYFDVPVTIGASLDSNGEPFRFFKGTLSNIVVKIYE